MANVDAPYNGSVILPTTAKIRYVNVEGQVYALLGAAVLTTVSGLPLVVDEDGVQVMIAKAHYEIHEGDMFSVSYKSPDAAPIADNGTIVLFLTTGTTDIHLIAGASAGGDAQGELYEGATVGAGGTAMTPLNRNRTSGNTSPVVVRRDAAVGGAGDLLEDVFIPGGNGPNAVGGSGTQRLEWVLRPSTVYMIRITNRAGNAQPMSVEAIWYEEDM